MTSGVDGLPDADPIEGNRFTAVQGEAASTDMRAALLARYESLDMTGRPGDAVPPELDGWSGPPWSLLLVPGWRELDGLELEQVVVEQWRRAATILLEDLEALDPDRCPLLFRGSVMTIEVILVPSTHDFSWCCRVESSAFSVSHRRQGR